MTNSPKYVLDTNVIVSALLFRNSQPRQALDKGRNSGVILMSEEVWGEIEEVLSRKKFHKYVNYGEKNIFLMELFNNVNFIEIKEKIIACRDPKDDKFLTLAVSASATAIISGDADLLELNPFRGISILNVRDFLMSN